MVHGESGVVSDMVDLTTIDLSDLAERHRDPDSPLARALKRVQTDAERPGDALAGFQSSL